MAIDLCQRNFQAVKRTAIVCVKRAANKEDFFDA